MTHVFPGRLTTKFKLSFHNTSTEERSKDYKNYLQIVNNETTINLYVLKKTCFIFQAEYYCNKYKPEIKITQNRYTVGRSVLQRNISNITSMTRYIVIQGLVGGCYTIASGLEIV